MKTTGARFFNFFLIMSISLALPRTAMGFELQKGETFHYDIKKLGVDLGNATLSFKGEVKRGGRRYLLAIFKAEALNFYDEERIYMDPSTMYPVLVERNLDIWGKKEKIREIYDQTGFKVKVLKEANGKTTEQTLKNDAMIDNIYCFLYRFRRSGTFNKEKELELNLPTKDVAILYDGPAEVEAADKKHQAVHYKSRPEQYRLWFGASEGLLPLRIDGTVGMGKTSLIMSVEPILTEKGLGG